MGSVGMIVTAMLHIFLSLILKLESGMIFLPMYLTWITFLSIGAAKLITSGKKSHL